MGLIDPRETPPGPMGGGAMGEDTRQSMGRRMVTAWTCTAFEPDRYFAIKVTKPTPFEAGTTWRPCPKGRT